MTPISYATHLNEAVVADNKLASCSFPRDKLFLSHIRSLPTAMGWMCAAPAKSNPGIWVQRLSLAPRLPESVSAGLAQVQTTTHRPSRLRGAARRRFKTTHRRPNRWRQGVQGENDKQKDAAGKPKYSNATQALNCACTSHEATLVAGATRTHDVMIEHIPAHYRKT